MMEEAIALNQLDLSKYDMLPRLLAQIGYRSRDEDLATGAKNSVTGAASLANPFISSDRDHTAGSLGLTWSLLDFGVGYYGAKSARRRSHHPRRSR